MPAYGQDIGKNDQQQCPMAKTVEGAVIDTEKVLTDESTQKCVNRCWKKVDDNLGEWPCMTWGVDIMVAAVEFQVRTDHIDDFHREDKSPISLHSLDRHRLPKRLHRPDRWPLLQDMKQAKIKYRSGAWERRGHQ